MHLLGSTTELRFGPSSITQNLKKSAFSRRLSLKIFSNNFYPCQTSKRISSQCLKTIKKTQKKTRRKSKSTTRRVSLKIDFIDIL